MEIILAFIYTYESQFCSQKKTCFNENTAATYQKNFKTVIPAPRTHGYFCPKDAVLSHVHAKLLCPWDFSGKHTGMGWHFLLQRSSPTQGSNPHLLHLVHCRWILKPLRHQGSPAISYRGHTLYRKTMGKNLKKKKTTLFDRKGKKVSGNILKYGHAYLRKSNWHLHIHMIKQML